MTALTAAATGRARDRIIVTGANGALGRSLLRTIGPDRAIAVSRGDTPPIPGFAHERFGSSGVIPPAALAASAAIINAAGRVRGSVAELTAANVELALGLARQARDADVPKFVQVGSFSVYGHAELIDTATPVAPVTNYGRSKATADQALFDLMTPGFTIESMRLPFLFSERRPALLAPLITLGRRLRLLPGSRPPMRRSMITYDDAARLMVAATDDRRRGATLAADPQPFDYGLLCRLVEEEGGGRWRVLDIPDVVIVAMSRATPELGRRLFRSSVLAVGSNRAGTDPLGLEPTLRTIVRNALSRKAS